jgi:integral membrane protein
MLATPLGRLRTVGLVEGASFLILLGIAMPLKYALGMPQAVSVVGMIHGLLWIAYVACIIEMRVVTGWPLHRCMQALAASVLPFGPFVLDRSLRQRAEPVRVR